MTIEERITNNRCCFCEAPLEGMGSNPSPACDLDDARCCRVCDWTIVMPARRAINQIITEGLNPKLRTEVESFLQELEKEALQKLQEFQLKMN